MSRRAWHDTKLGPRSTGLKPGEYDDFRDPDDPAPYCMTCEQRQGKLLDFGLVLYGRPAGHYCLCERCWRIANPPDPRATDPLQAA